MRWNGSITDCTLHVFAKPANLLAQSVLLSLRERNFLGAGIISRSEMSTLAAATAVAEN
jgi:hypothetical protein